MSVPTLEIVTEVCEARTTLIVSGCLFANVTRLELLRGPTTKAVFYERLAPLVWLSMPGHE